MRGPHPARQEVSRVPIPRDSGRAPGPCAPRSPVKRFSGTPAAVLRPLHGAVWPGIGLQWPVGLWGREEAGSTAGQGSAASGRAHAPHATFYRPPPPPLLVADWLAASAAAPSEACPCMAVQWIPGVPRDHAPRRCWRRISREEERGALLLPAALSSEGGCIVRQPSIFYGGGGA